MTIQTSKDPLTQGPTGGQLSLWDVISFMSGVVATGNSWAAAEVAGSSVAGKALAVLLGCVVGVGCIFFIRKIGSLVTNALGQKGNGGAEQTERIGGALIALYLAAALWLVASGVIGYQVTAHALHIL